MNQFIMWNAFLHKAVPSWNDSAYENVSFRGLKASGLNLIFLYNIYRGFMCTSPGGST